MRGCCEVKKIKIKYNIAMAFFDPLDDLFLLCVAYSTLLICLILLALLLIHIPSCLRFEYQQQQLKQKSKKNLRNSRRQIVHHRQRRICR